MAGVIAYQNECVAMPSNRGHLHGTHKISMNVFDGILGSFGLVFGRFEGAAFRFSASAAFAHNRQGR